MFKMLTVPIKQYAPIAQLDRALVYGTCLAYVPICSLCWWQSIALRYKACASPKSLQVILFGGPEQKPLVPNLVIKCTQFNMRP